MSMFERNEPKIVGQPGRISCTSVMPASASAICWASVAGIETGDMAPIRRNGVSSIAWFAAAYSKSASSMRPSQRSGELQLTSEIIADVCSIASREPNRISLMRIESAAFGPDTTLPM